MTTLVAWCGGDNNGLNSIYIASDSRITYRGQHWQYGRKVFASKLFPIIIGYSGDVNFPSIHISRMLDLIDSNLLDMTDFHKFIAFFENSIKINLPQYNFDSETKIFICGSYIDENSAYKHFSAAEISITKNKSVRVTYQNMPDASNLVHISGSGTPYFEDNLKNIIKDPHDVFRSRYAYFALMETIKSGRDISTGGAPQIAALQRDGTCFEYGILFNGVRHFQGMALGSGIIPQNIKWINENMERLDPYTLNLMTGAQRQPY